MVNFTVGDVPEVEPFVWQEWIHTKEGIIVIMVVAGIVAFLVNVAVYRRRNRKLSAS